jgi:hypothetical protein
MVAWWCGRLGRVLGGFQGRLRAWAGDLGTSIATGGRSGPCVTSTLLKGEAVWFEANTGAEGCVHVKASSRMVIVWPGRGNNVARRVLMR